MVRLHRLESVASQLNVPTEVVSALVKELCQENRLEGIFDPEKNAFLRVKYEEARTLGAELNNNITVLSEFIEKLDLPADTVQSLLDWLVSEGYTEGFFTIDGDFFVGRTAFFESIRNDLRSREPVLISDIKANLKMNDEQLRKLLENSQDERLIVDGGQIFSFDFLRDTIRRALDECSWISLSLDRLSRITRLDAKLIARAFQYFGANSFQGWDYESGSRILVREHSVAWSPVYRGFRIVGPTAIGHWEFGEEMTCCVCQLNIKESQVFTTCRHCGRRGHLNHFLEWVKVKGDCPVCRKSLSEEDLRTRSRQYLIN